MAKAGKADKAGKVVEAVVGGPDDLPAWKVGDIATFSGYADAADDPTLKPGDRVLLEKEEDNGSFVVVAVDGDGLKLEPELVDNLFPDEICTEEEWVATRAVAPGTAIAEVQIVLTPAVQELVQEDRDALEAAKRLLKQIDNSYFTLGGVLAFIYERSLHRSKGYVGKRGWNDYLDRELPGISYRTAMYLIGIYKSFSAVGIDESSIGQFGGWAKAKEIARITRIKDADGTPIGERLLRENLANLVTVSQKSNRAELADYVRDFMQQSGEKPPGGHTRPVRHTVTYRLYDGQTEVLDQAISTALRVSGTRFHEHALLHICSEWLLAQGQAVPPLAEAVRAMEARYGVRLSVAQPEESVAA